MEFFYGCNWHVWGLGPSVVVYREGCPGGYPVPGSGEVSLEVGPFYFGVQWPGDSVKPKAKKKKR